MGEEYTCYNIPIVAQAGANNQMPAASLCRNCPNSYAQTLRNLGGGSVTDKKPLDDEEQKRLNRAKAWLRANPNIDIDTVPACFYLADGLKKNLRAEIVVAPYGAFSHALARWTPDIRTTDPRQRIVFVDEGSYPLANRLDVSPESVAEWIDGCVDFGKRYVPPKDDEVRSDSQKILDRVALNLPKIEVLLRDLGKLLMGGDELPDAKGWAVVYKAIGGGCLTGHIWEKLILDANGYKIPLRAFAAIHHSLKAGAAYRDGTTLVVHEQSAIVAHAAKHGGTIFLDGTPGSGIEKIVENARGRVINIDVPQNLTITHYTGARYGKGRPGSGSDKSAGAARRLDQIKYTLQGIADDAPSDAPKAVITHKATLQYAVQGQSAEQTAAQFEKETGVAIGWWGRHDRGHNNWRWRDILIFGLPVLSPKQFRATYGKEAAALAFLGIESAPFSDKVSRDFDVMPLPVDGALRAWILRYCAISVAQAIGRARAARSERQIRVTIFGGYEGSEWKQALAGYGIEIDNVLPNIYHQQTLYGRARTQENLCQAIDEIHGAGHQVTAVSIRDWLRCNKKSASNEAICVAMRDRRATGELPPARARRGSRAWEDWAGANRCPVLVPDDWIDMTDHIPPAAADMFCRRQI